ncbi:hypothetical protein BA78_8862, partial [Aspergillus fumigatus]
MSQLTGFTRQPAARSSRTNRAPSAFWFWARSRSPALRERRIRFWAPWSTSQCAIDRPMPPTPPTTRYDASERSRGRGVIPLGRGTTGTTSSGPAGSTTFPMCAPVCRNRKASWTCCVGCIVTGLDGLQGALVHQTGDLAQDAVDVGSATAQERGHIQRGQRDAARDALQRDQAVCLDLFLAEFDQMAEGRDDAEAGLQEWTGQR